MTVFTLGIAGDGDLSSAACIAVDIGFTCLFSLKESVAGSVQPSDIRSVKVARPATITYRMEL
jgi:hypothetical protein